MASAIVNQFEGCRAVSCVSHPRQSTATLLLTMSETDGQWIRAFRIATAEPIASRTVLHCAYIAEKPRTGRKSVAFRKRHNRSGVKNEPVLL